MRRLHRDDIGRHRAIRRKGEGWAGNTDVSIGAPVRELGESFAEKDSF